MNFVNIAYNNTLKHYDVCKDKSKRQKLGGTVGKLILLDEKSQEFLAHSLARLDQANEGAEPGNVYEIIEELKPGLKRRQARDHFRRRTLRPKQKDVIKQNNLSAQATTSKRNEIIVVFHLAQLLV